MHTILTAAVWIGVYLALVLAPLLVLMIGDVPGRPVPGSGGTSPWPWGSPVWPLWGVQFVLTARFRRANAPFGINIIYYFHRYLAVTVFGVVRKNCLTDLSGRMRYRMCSRRARSGLSRRTEGCQMKTSTRWFCTFRAW